MYERTVKGRFANGWTCAGHDTRKHFLNTYKGIQDKWVPENQGKHLCQCGCGEFIIVKPHHYRPGIPRFVPGHYNRTVEYKFLLADRNRKRNKERHWNWQGGITPKEEALRKSIEYAEWRDKVFARDFYTCQECGKRCGNGKTIHLHAHHKVPFSVIVKAHFDNPDILNARLFDIDNGLTLCQSCHNAIPRPPRGPVRK